MSRGEGYIDNGGAVIRSLGSYRIDNFFVVFFFLEQESIICGIRVRSDILSP